MKWVDLLRKQSPVEMSAAAAYGFAGKDKESLLSGTRDSS